MQIGCARVGEQPLDCGLEITPLHQLPPRHHGVGVEGTNRERAQAELLGHVADLVIGLFALAHINRKAHAVGRLDLVVLVVDEDQFVAWPGVRETDAAGIAGIARIRGPAHRAFRGKFGIGQGEQMGETLGRQTDNPKAHDRPPFVLRTIWRQKAPQPTRFRHPIPDNFVRCIA